MPKTINNDRICHFWFVFVSASIGFVPPVPADPSGEVTMKSVEGKAFPVVAVLPFGGRVATPEQSTKLTRCFTLGIFDSDSFDVVEQRTMNRVSREPGFPRLDSCVGEGCVGRVGKALGADQVFSGQIERSGEVWTITLHRLEVGTGAFASNRTLDVHGAFDDVLELGCRELVAFALDGSGKRDGHKAVSAAHPKVWPWVVGGLAVAGGVATTIFVLSGSESHDRGRSDAGTSPQMVLRW